MGSLTKLCKQKLDSVPFRQLISGLEGNGMTLHGACPKCGATGKKKSKWIGLWVKDDDVRNQHMIGCNTCGWKTGRSSINMMMEYLGVEFMDACKEISKRTGIELEFEDNERRRSVRTPLARPDNDGTSFVSQQLAASGLTYDDVRATVTDGRDELQV